jgi:hypothetical protein
VFLANLVLRATARKAAYVADLSRIRNDVFSRVTFHVAGFGTVYAKKTYSLFRTSTPSSCQSYQRRTHQPYVEIKNAGCVGQRRDHFALDRNAMLVDLAVE